MTMKTIATLLLLSACSSASGLGSDVQAANERACPGFNSIILQVQSPPTTGCTTIFSDVVTVDFAQGTITDGASAWSDCTAVSILWQPHATVTGCMLQCQAQGGLPSVEAFSGPVAEFGLPYVAERGAETNCVSNANLITAGDQ
jgi:hypothetical protein